MMNSDLAAAPYYGHNSFAKVKVVEYLECSMSKGLLCKFPDNSPFDFDYSQSSIWSPLIRRPSSRILQNSDEGITEKTVPLHDVDGFNGLNKTKAVTVNIEKKFTDSSFDFDDSQSSIWSPLIPRTSARNLQNSVDIPEKPVLDDDEFNGVTRIKAMTANIKRKFTDAVKDNLQMYQNLKKRKRKSQDFSSLARTPRKGWGKVLKVGSKQFKKMKKTDCSIAHMNFRRCITGG